ncbi:MAG: hypothetical protein PHC53_04395 [Patescibacteria group bacterium]|nr:hypothetical protein [Patescibacteria group bacterium]
MRKSKKRQGIWQFINNPFLVIGVLVLVSIPILIVLLSQRMKAEVREAAQPQEAACANPKVNNEVFTKTYHLRDLTQGFGVVPTKDGGYLLSGDTIWSSGMSIPNPFVIKTDAKGNALWSKQFSSQSLALGMLSSRHIGRLAAETTDGNIVVAQDILDFNDAKYEVTKEVYGDILITKLDPKGNKLWSTMIGDWSIDRPQKIWATPDGGVFLLGKFMKTGYGSEADTEAAPKYSIMAKVDKNGKVQWTKKLSWAAVDMQYLADGSFVALTDINIPLPEGQKGSLGQEAVMTDLPTIIRLDSNLNTLWAKSVESIPMEINNVVSVSTTGLTMGKTKLRMTAGDFNSVQPTPDGGFIALGRYPMAAYQLTPGNTGITSLLDPIPYVGVKVDGQGNYKWAKRLKTPFGTYGIDFNAVKTNDGGFVLIRDVIRDTAGWAAKSKDLANKQEVVTKKCKEFNCKMPGDENKIPEVKSYAEAAYKAAMVMNEAMASNIEVIKTDADFNPKWIKKLDVERDLSGYDVQPTADGGLVVSARIVTTKKHMVMGSLEPYEEAILIKLDVNGNAGGCLAVSDQRQVSLDDVSPYIIMQNMVVTAENLKLAINQSVKPRVSAIKDTVRDICQYKKSLVMPTCGYLTSNTIGGTGSTGGTSTPTAKTWAQINYENAKEGKLENAKSQQINDELMVILKKISNNQVKMTDNLAGMMLDYIFPRLLTRADVEEVQKYYQGLGYKIDESEGGTLYVSRIGLTLHMDFHITNLMSGKLEVLY